MNEKRSAFLAECREWLSTPYHHQASLKGVGADCVGFVRGAAAAQGLVEIGTAEWARIAVYSRLPNPRRMRALLEKYLTEVSETEAGPGDLVWLEWRTDLPMHLAVIGHRDDGRTTLIHACALMGRSPATPQGRVTEHDLTAEWRARINSWWRIPGLGD